MYSTHLTISQKYIVLSIKMTCDLRITPFTNIKKINPSFIIDSTSSYKFLWLLYWYIKRKEIVLSPNNIIVEFKSEHNLKFYLCYTNCGVDELLLEYTFDFSQESILLQWCQLRWEGIVLTQHWFRISDQSLCIQVIIILLEILTMLLGPKILLNSKQPLIHEYPNSSYCWICWVGIFFTILVIFGRNLC